MSSMAATLNFELHPEQVRIWSHRRRFNVVNCGRRFGKTILAEAVLAENITTGDPAAYFAPTYKMLMEVWRTVKRDLQAVIKETNESEKRITYKYRGLPPGPISNPGEQAMLAAVNPADGDWLYYVTVKPRDTRFTKSFEEFNVWANEFKKSEDVS